MFVWGVGNTTPLYCDNKMFGKRNDIDMGRIIPTSKMTLKMSCLAACGNDIESAKKLYEYIASDMTDLPDLDPANPTILQQADSILGWIGQHRDEFMQGISLFQSMREKVGSSVANVAPIPPIK